MQEQNSMSVFRFNGTSEVRVKTIDNEPWFIAKDVAEILSYSSPDKMYSRLDDDEKTTTPYRRNGSNYQTNVTLISESGLYNAIMGSQKPEAKQFKKWVTSEVLPSIRKHGMYATPQTLDNMLSDPDFAIRLFTELKDERAKRIEAERTKAFISDKKTATALVTASHLSRKVNKLENQLGMGKTWKRISRIFWLDKYFDMRNKNLYPALACVLGHISDDMKCEVKRVPDERYGEVNAYHVDVIESFHERIKNDKNETILPKFRFRRYTLDWL